MNAFSLLRGVYGGVVSVAPSMVVRAYSGRPARGPDVAVARVLGARQLVQAGACAGAPGPAVLLLGAETDVAHALSAITLAVVDRTRRRAGMVEAAVAATFATIGVMPAGRASAGIHAEPGTGPMAALASARERAAVRAASLALPAPVRRRAEGLLDDRE